MIDKVKRKYMVKRWGWPFALRTSHFALCSSHFALCSSHFALRSSLFAHGSSHFANCILVTQCYTEGCTVFHSVNFVFFLTVPVWFEFLCMSAVWQVMARLKLYPLIIGLHLRIGEKPYPMAYYDAAFSLMSDVRPANLFLSSSSTLR